MLSSLFRWLPAFRGKHRIADLLFKRDLPNNQDITIKGKFGCVYKIPNIKEYIGFDIFVNGVYEKDTILFIAGSIPKNGVMVDIGANIGTIVFPVCKLRSDIQALAIEASPRVFDYLDTNKQNNQVSNCTLVNKAISDKDGEMVSFYSPVEQFGKGSMSNVFTNDAETIETIRLDTLIKEHTIEKIDFIKIDVEGYEYYAFKGAENILRKEDAPVILFEFADWAEDLAKGIDKGAAQKLLMEYGYTLYHVKEKGHLHLMQEPLIKGTVMIMATKQKL